MNKSIKINGDTHLLTRDIKFVREVSPEEQAVISERYQVDGTQFNCAIQLSNSDKPILVREDKAALDAQLGLVNLGNGKLVPAETIIKARSLNKEGREALAAKGLNISENFRATVEITSGIMLSTAYPGQVMERKAAALERIANINANSDDHSADYVEPADKAPEVSGAPSPSDAVA
ncbi:MAG: hypothetical protein AAFR90_12880 [Pseudomonadota bacterium]